MGTQTGKSRALRPKAMGEAKISGRGNETLEVARSKDSHELWLMPEKGPLAVIGRTSRVKVRKTQERLPVVPARNDGD